MYGDGVTKNDETAVELKHKQMYLVAEDKYWWIKFSNTYYIIQER